MLSSSLPEYFDSSVTRRWTGMQRTSFKFLFLIHIEPHHKLYSLKLWIIHIHIKTTPDILGIFVLSLCCFIFLRMYVLMNFLISCHRIYYVTDILFWRWYLFFLSWQTSWMNKIENNGVLIKAINKSLTTCGARKFSVARARTVERESLRGAFRQRSAGGFQKRK